MITITYGDKITQNTYETLTASDITSYLTPNMTVSIKPNLVVPGPASNGATTHPEVVEGIILFLKELGVTNIRLCDWLRYK